MTGRTCTIEGCESSHRALGYCYSHYKRFKRYGDPTAGRWDAAPRTSDALGARLERRLTLAEGGCIEWTGGTNAAGYGEIRADDRRKILTHRAAWELANGKPIPDGALVCHSCDNRLCCNADHLFLGTHADNSQDMVNKGRQARGERQASSVLTEADVALIHELRASGWTLAAIGERVGTSKQNASKICRGDRWKHVEVPR